MFSTSHQSQAQTIMTPMDDTKAARKTSAHATMECQIALECLVEQSPAIRFASLATVDGRSLAHANDIAHAPDPQRFAALMGSLLGLVESFSREALGSKPLYNSIATEHGSIVTVRLPTQAKLHALCICADESESLGMTIRTALDTADQLARLIDAAH